MGGLRQVGKDIVQPVIECFQIYSPREADQSGGAGRRKKDVILAVEDQGIGIAENKQKSLFVRFENLVDKNLFNQASTGIGLSLVKELIDMHHGSISIRSKLGEGSCFSIRLQKGKRTLRRNR